MKSALAFLGGAVIGFILGVFVTVVVYEADPPRQLG